MTVEVRPIAAEELERWVDTMHLAFHNSRAAAPEVAYRRDFRGQDYARTLAAFDGERIVGTYETFAADLTLPGGARVPTNAISAVSVLPTHHRRGVLRRMLTEDLHAACERGELASILIAAEYPIYGRFGFGPATEQAAYRLEVVHAHFTQPATGSVDLIEPTRMRQLAPGIFERFRHERPGQIDRDASSWEVRLGLHEVPWRSGGKAVRSALYTSPSGEPEGYLLYGVESEWRDHLPSGNLHIDEMVTLSSAAYLGLWRYCAEIDLVGEINCDMRPIDEPLQLEI